MKNFNITSKEKEYQEKFFKTRLAREKEESYISRKRKYSYEN